jgi:hypothetical protein
MKVPPAVARYFMASPEAQVTLGEFTPVSGTTTSTMEFVPPTEEDSSADLALRDDGLIRLTSGTPTAEELRAFLKYAARYWAAKAAKRTALLALPEDVDPKSPEGIEAATAKQAELKVYIADHAARKADLINFYERVCVTFLSLAKSAPSNSAASNSASSS